MINAALAALVAAAAPSQPRLSDRAEVQVHRPPRLRRELSEFDLLLSRPGADAARASRRRSRACAGGRINGSRTPRPAPSWRSQRRRSHRRSSPATVVQSSYAFAFTAYDPFTSDPLVFLIAALTLYLWMADGSARLRCDGRGRRIREGNGRADRVGAGDRRRCSHERPRVGGGLARGAAAWSCCLASIGTWTPMRAGASGNAASNFAAGSWLAIWWKNNPSLARKA